MNLATFGNFFGPDTLIIFLVILLLFGAKKLPELARGMGQAVREFSKAKDDIEREVTRPPATEEPRALHDRTHDGGHDASHDTAHASDPYHQEPQVSRPEGTVKTETKDPTRVS